LEDLSSIQVNEGLQTKKKKRKKKWCLNFELVWISNTIFFIDSKQKKESD